MSRAREALAGAPEEHSFLAPFATVLDRPAEGQLTWWTLAGLLANAQLASWTETRFGLRPTADNLRLQLDSSIDPQDLRPALDEIRGAPPFDLATALLAADRLKFRQCLPAEALWTVLQSRYGGEPGLGQVLDESLRLVRTAPS